jgi:PhzF family phenazine biosynthesis protein
MRLPLYQIDAFTDRAFAGNPAAVVPLAEWLPDDLMQRIAAEMNLAETAFFVAEGNGYRLRWFTPSVEVPLCGHATLASAFVLTRFLKPQVNEIRFESKSGPLFVRRLDEKLELDFPAWPVTPKNDVALTDRIAAAIGQRPVELAESFAYVARLSDAAAVKSVSPDFAAMKGLDKDLIVTAAGTGGVDFVSRFFAPLYGIPEDPVTGSTHCALAPFWAARLGKRSFHARQVSSRGGDLWVSLEGERVKIAGHAVCVLTGSMEIPD